MELKDKKVVVIGGSSGIGLAIAQATAAAGAKVVISGRSAYKLEEALAEIEANVLAYPVDVTDMASLQDFFQREGQVDHLIMAGGTVKTGGFKEMPVADAIASMNSKFFGAYRAVQAATVSPAGSITLFSGVLSRRPTPGTAAIAAVNAAVEGLGRALAIELAPVRVNVISPGLVKTPSYSGMPDEQRENLYQSTAASLPVGYVGEPEDVAVVALMLMTTPYITGTIVDVDGGSLLV
ncbi:MAG: SDR family oxidoreductase [Cyanobacteria bacterium J06639_16]